MYNNKKKAKIHMVGFKIKFMQNYNSPTLKSSECWILTIEQQKKTETEAMEISLLIGSTPF